MLNITQKKECFFCVKNVGTPLSYGSAKSFTTEGDGEGEEGDGFPLKHVR
mgnify:CR=1 FL=1